MVELGWDGWLVPQIADELRWDLGGQGRKRRIAEAERSRIIGPVRQDQPGRLDPAVE
ncbi:hypothetical protein [Streptomyces canus]|uniref:Uncharacterized protein n=1 Tax=Streptomyces canus TaxID=58343 RepID=A0AAW8F4P4_9ACTN|nr:hypothetical protein [Streptomyces canus]MDQ0905076.1 hypothetical protein [Streptomyces canus]MDQ1064924.1 hypothetical protein [Streptomyces canus]